MRLLVVSHPCIVPSNQALFARVAARHGWQITLVTPARWRTEYGSRSAATNADFKGRVRTVEVALSGNIPLHFYRARLSRLLAEERPDAIYVHHEAYAAATFQVFWAARGFRQIPIGFFSCQNIRKRYRWPFSAMERYVYAHADFAFPVSDAVAQVLRQKGYRGSVTVLPFGVDTQAYRPGPSQPHQAANGGAPLRLGYIGRLTQEKGIDTLLSALTQLPPHRVRTVVVGDGPAAATLRRQSRALGLDDVTWSGYIPHEKMPSAYREVDLLVVPSRTTPRWREQFGRVAIEAMACGVPVVTSDSGELPRLIDSTGGGWSFPEGNSSALAATIAPLIDRREELIGRGRLGREAVARQFDLSVVADRFATAVRQSPGGRDHP
jgi:glycosyltransferase involved in cell wall biosynthesis